ncbi:hypothetical protein M3Y99_01835300 [Aphelenchoides fujianensis]|nr:hypothetical protein M3Y99_01835300 [Aphelenchoides fujianensis]
MARHRRYPTKKKQKIKAGDPDQRASRPTTKGRANAPPKDEDDQLVPRRLKEIREAQEAAANQPQRRPSKKQTKNKFFAMTAKMGYKPRPWENEEMLAHRVLQSKNGPLKDELVKARFGLAGRDTKEIDADFQLLDEKEKRKRALKIALREKRLKQKEKEANFRSNRGSKEAPVFDEEDDEEEDDRGEFVDDEEVAEEVEDSEEEEDEQKPPPPKKKADRKKDDEEKEAEEPKQRRLTSSEKKRLRKKTEKAEAEKHLILNAREIIPFGERVDAPPVFSKNVRKLLDSGQAGKKDLLLKDLLRKNEKPAVVHEATESDGDSDEKPRVIGKLKRRVSEAERLRTIEAYRQLKKKKEQRLQQQQ